MSKKESKKKSKGLTDKQHKEVASMISKGVEGITGDMSEYLNYLHERLDQISEHLDLPLLSYEAELSRRYNFKLRR